MSDRPRSSRALYRRYVADLVQRRKSRQHIHTDDRGQPRSRGRSRTASDLVREFWRLMGPERAPVLFALGTLSIATLLALIPPAATKFVVDYVLTDHPLPSWLTESGFSAGDRFGLLTAVVATVILVSLAQVVLGI